MTDFITVCRETDIAPNAAQSFIVNGKEIAVYHIAGKFYATQNACLHRNGPLAEGELKECTVICPWHGWEYDIPTGANLLNRAAKLKTFAVQVKHGEVQVAA